MKRQKKAGRSKRGPGLWVGEYQDPVSCCNAWHPLLECIFPQKNRAKGALRIWLQDFNDDGSQVRGRLRRYVPEEP